MAALSSTLRRSLRCIAILLFLFMAIVGTSALALAGTITIVHDNSLALTGPALYSDGYLRLQLASGNVTLDTSSAPTGTDDIHVQNDVVITWTTDSRLTLLAGRTILVSGTIQHDGPQPNGAPIDVGGLLLRADNDNDGVGDVEIGASGLLTGAAIGSRFGDTQIDAVTLRVQGGSGADAYAQVGFRGMRQGEAFTITGPITVQVDLDLLLHGGGMTNTYAQIGHVGADLLVTSTLTTTLPISVAARTAATITIGAGRHLDVQGGSGSRAYAATGHGGFAAHGPLYGSLVISAGGDIRYSAGSGAYGYVQLGAGGAQASGEQQGDQRVEAAGNILFQGGMGEYAYAQLGNGGLNALESNSSGNQWIRALGQISATAGITNGAYVQMGNGGLAHSGLHSGTVQIVAQGSIYARADISETAAIAGTGAYVLIGHGDGDGIAAGIRRGDILVISDESLVLAGARVGHLSADGAFSVTQGLTTIGVGQAGPLASGLLSATQTVAYTTTLASARSLFGGELRLYAPVVSAFQLAAGALLNGEIYSGTVPADRLFRPFALGVAMESQPYQAESSYYSLDALDLSVRKQLQAAGVMTGTTLALLPGQPLTYTIHVSNSGFITATLLTLSDLLRAQIGGEQVVSHTLASLLANQNRQTYLAPGATISQTHSGPAARWEVSNLGPEQNGTLTLTAHLSPSLSADGIITNVAALAITTTIELSAANNLAVVTATIRAPRVALSPTTYLVSERAGIVVLTLELDRPNPYAPVRVPYTVTSGAVISSPNFVPMGGMVLFPPGSQSQTITVTLVDEQEVAPDETFTVTLGGAAGPVVGAILTNGVARVTVQNDDSAPPPPAPPTLVVSKSTDRMRVQAGQTITYTVMVTNTGVVTFPFVAAVDDLSGAVTLDRIMLPPGASARGATAYAVQNSDLPGPLVNHVQVVATRPDNSAVQASAAVTVPIVSPAIALRKTVGLGSGCAPNAFVSVPLGSTVHYCFSATNTGDVTLTGHTLVDERFGTLLAGVAITLAPGASHQITRTQTFPIGGRLVVEVATWTATAPELLPAQSEATSAVEVRLEDANGIRWLYLPVVKLRF